MSFLSCTSVKFYMKYKTKILHLIICTYYNLSMFCYPRSISLHLINYLHVYLDVVHELLRFESVHIFLIHSMHASYLHIENFNIERDKFITRALVLVKFAFLGYLVLALLRHMHYCWVTNHQMFVFSW